jgi:hypothetical protein
LASRKPIRVLQFDRYFDRTFHRSIQITAHGQRPIILQRPHRLRVNILDKSGRHYAHLDVAIDAAEGQVIDVAAERGNVGAPSNPSSTASRLSPPKLRCGVTSKENGVYPPLYSGKVPVYGNGCGGHRSGEIQENALTLPAGQSLEIPPIAGNELENPGRRSYATAGVYWRAAA